MKELEARAGEALRQLLARIPIIEIKDIEHELASVQGKPDLIAHIHADGRPYLLICEFQSNGQLRHARTALLELRDYVARLGPEAAPIFMAPYISPAVRRLCQEKNVGYLDLEGNARITFGGVFIERMVAVDKSKFVCKF